jgi:hypothetical protein
MQDNSADLSVMAASTAVTNEEVVWFFFGSWSCRDDRPRWNSRLETTTRRRYHERDWLTLFLKWSLFVFGSSLAIVPFLHGGVLRSITSLAHHPGRVLHQRQGSGEL